MALSRLLILGSSSFGGGWVVNHALDAGFETVGVGRSSGSSNLFLPYAGHKRLNNFTYHMLDLNKDTQKVIELVQQYRPDFVVDFAGQGMVSPSWQWPEQWYMTNLVSKTKVLNALKNCGSCKKYIRVSTPEVYGSTEELITESTDYNPSTPYSISHVAIDQHVMAYQKQFGFPAILGRFSNFFGPHQQLYRIVPRAMISALSGFRLPLHGGGESVRSFIHGSDVAEGIMQMIERGVPGEIYHFSTKEFVTIRRVVELICNITSSPFESFVSVTEDRAGKDAAYLMSSQKAHAELAWQAKFDLESGLENTFSWVEKNISALQVMSLDYKHQE